MTSNFDYKKYSLERLEEWMHDAMSAGEAAPQEIYDVIVGVVKENYYTYKHQTSQAYELLTLLNNNPFSEEVKSMGELWDREDKTPSCDNDDTSSECKGAWNDFWEEHYYPEEVKKDDGMRPWGHSDLEYMIANPTLTEDRVSNFPGEQYTEEELDAMCDKAASDEEKEKCREYNLRESEYYDKRAQLDFGRNRTYDEMISAGYKMTDDGFWIPPQKKDKVVKWQLPVEVDASGEYFVTFPDDLLEAANLKEGDNVRWVDNGDGSYTITKITEPLKMDEC